MIEVLIVYTCGILIDVFYALWAIQVTRKAYSGAALSSMAIGSCFLFGVLEVIDTPILSVPYVLGLGLGTVLGMKLGELWHAK